jgi:ABC-type Fe3+ transport system permease subunit
MTRETTIARVLLVLVFAPAGGLFGKAVAEAAQGRSWWPWLIAALVWLVVLGGLSMAVSNHVHERR